jgi:hypothetical protein
MSARTRADPIQIGALGDKDRQIERDDPGEQTQGRTEGEASAPESAGNWLSRRESGAERDRLWLAKQLGLPLPRGSLSRRAPLGGLVAWSRVRRAC